MATTDSNLLLPFNQRQCTKCKTIKSYSEFHRDKRTGHGVRPHCKSCEIKDRQPQPPLTPAQERQKYLRNREAKLAQVARYKQLNPDKVRIKNQRYRASNKGKGNAIKALYRADRIRATPPWSDRKGISRVYQLAERLTVETGIPHDVDHIVPLRSRVVCGLHIPINLQCIPHVENMRKKNRFQVVSPLGS